MRHLQNQKFMDLDSLKTSGMSSSNTPAADIALNNNYMEYVNRIFRWSMYRERQLIQRKDMDDNLTEMRKLAESFGNPQENMKIIHVAGTNGKGSVTLKVASTL